MKTRNVWMAALFLMTCAGGTASATDTVLLTEMTASWFGLLKSGDMAVRNAASGALADIVRKHPAAANDVVQRMAAEENGDISAEHVSRLVPLAKESPATVSAFIRLIRHSGTNYRARNFGVKVLSQVGPAAATPEFVEALAETYCPVPGAYWRILRAMGKDAAPVLAAGYRHPNEVIRKRSTAFLRSIGRTDPIIQKLFNDLQAEGGLLLKLRDGTPPDRIAAIGALAEMARTTPGTGALLVNSMKNVTDKTVVAEAESRLVTLGRESPETVAALLAGVRAKDTYRVRILAMKVLPKVGPMLNCTATIEALADDYCPVPHMMRRILLAAGSDALPVLSVAQTHPNQVIRAAAENILKQLPRPVAAAKP